MKAKFKLKGLVNVSGFHVDPGWNGRLIFAVFNAGPAAVHLQRGLPVFLLWIADLDEASKKRKTAPGEEGIPPMIINNVTGVVDSLYALDNRMKEEVKTLSHKDTELGERMHKIDKQQIRILIGFAIAGGILLTLVGVATRAAWLSFFH